VWLFEDAIPELSNVVVGAPEKSLKSKLVAVAMAVAVATGADWLGYFKNVTAEPRRVLLGVNEALKPILADINLMITESGASDPVHVINAVGMSLNESVDNVRDIVVHYNIDVVIWDAAYGFIPGDTRSESVFSMGDMLALVKKLGDITETTNLVVHHFNKSGRHKGRPTLNDLSWSGFKEWADSWILLCHRREPRPDFGEFKIGMIAGTRQASEHAYNVDVQIDIQLNSTSAPVFSAEETSFHDADKWGTGKSEEQAQADALGKRQQAKTWIVERLAENPYSENKGDLVEALNSGGDEYPRDAARAAIDEMVASSEIVKVKIKALRGERVTKTGLYGIDASRIGRRLHGIDISDDYPKPPKEGLI
jgi:RecA-family ATPase